VYCVEKLRLSGDAAYNRIEVARASRRFPLILEMLAAGDIHVTAARLLAPHLTDANHRSVLESAKGKSRREVEQIVARLSPQPDVPTSIRKLPAPAAAPSLPAVPPPPPQTPQPPSAPARIAALAPERFKLQLTVGGGTVEKLRLAQDMLRHAIPSGDEAEIIDRALALLLDDLARKKFADTERPRPSRDAAPGSRHIPAAVKRAVWLRDMGRCAYVGTSGKRCGSRAYLEFHHVIPYAAGGEATVANLSLRCAAHNAHEAEIYFGHRGVGRGDGLVRESPEGYGLPDGQRTCFETSWPARAVPP
jgi:hypothetical protein